MKRRRARGLGSSPAEHTRRAGEAAEQVASYADQAGRLAARGDCDKALEQLIGAAGSRGRLFAEVEGGAPAIGQIVGAADTLVRSARRDVQACFRSRR